MIDQLEGIIKSEEAKLKDYENMIQSYGPRDLVLYERYYKLLKEHKQLITAIGLMVNDIHILCNYDALTHVFSRHYLLEILEDKLKFSLGSYEVMTIAMMDVDDFKIINDSLGHQAGDEVLKKIAKQLNAGIRAQDMVGRYGGEEFLLILPGADEFEAITILERLRQGIETKCSQQRDNQALTVTASFGFVTYEGQPFLAADELIYLADMALQEAKEKGKNRVISCDELLNIAI